MGAILNLRNQAPEPVLLTATPDCFSQTADMDENIGQVSLTWCSQNNPGGSVGSQKLQSKDHSSFHWALAHHSSVLSMGLTTAAYLRPNFQNTCCAGFVATVFLAITTCSREWSA